MRLDVALPAGADLFESGALTEYLFPLAQRLGSDRIASMWASKSHAGRESTLRVARAHVIPGPAGEDWSVACVRATGSAALPAWKVGVRDQLAARAGAAPEGPLEMEVAFRAGRGRSWINLWRQAMDSLGPVLGLAKAGQPFHPRGGRVVRLGLHHSLATELGHDVEIAFCWRPAGSRARVRAGR